MLFEFSICVYIMLFLILMNILDPSITCFSRINHVTSLFGNFEPDRDIGLFYHVQWCTPSFQQDPKNWPCVVCCHVKIRVGQPEAKEKFRIFVEAMARTWPT